MSDEIIKAPKIQVGKTLYRHDYCSMLVNHMKDGNSFASFAVSVGVSQSTCRKWLDKYEEFADAYELAKDAAMAHWENIAYDQAVGNNKGSAASLIFMLKNRFSDDYKDKQTLEHEGNVVFQIDTGLSAPPTGYLPDPDQPIEADSRVIEEDEDLL